MTLPLVAPTGRCTVKTHLLDEIVESVSGGNKVATGLIAALIVWWAACINPFPLSAPGSPLEVISLIRKDQAFLAKECREQAAEENSAKELLLRNCLLENETAQVNVDQLIKRVQPRLSTLPERCDTAKIGNRLKEKRDACTTAAEELKRTIKEARETSELEFLSLKLKRVHPIYFPLFFCILLVGSALWIGSRRRALFLLLEEYLSQSISNNSLNTSSSSDHNATRVVLQTVPWWLWPWPSRIPRKLGFDQELFRDRDLKSARFAALLVAGAMMFGVAGALIVQQALSSPRTIQYDGKPLTAGLELSVTGIYLVDLILIGISFSLSVVLYLGLESVHRPSDQPSLHSRREVLHRISFISLGVISGAVLGPLLGDRSAVVGVLRREWNSYTLFRPRRRQKRKLSIAPRAGWFLSLGKYRSGARRRPRQMNAHEVPILHYAMGAEEFTRNNVWPPKRKRHRKEKSGKAATNVVRSWSRFARESRQTIKRQAGVIQGVGPTYQPTWKSVEFASSAYRLNKAFYSTGLEAEALMLWIQGYKTKALDVLKIGLDQIDKQHSARINIRLYDLFAGLLVRSGRIQELDELAKRLEARKQSVHNRWMEKTVKEDNKRIESRLRAWRADGSKWRAQWASDGHTWAKTKI